MQRLHDDDVAGAPVGTHNESQDEAPLDLTFNSLRGVFNVDVVGTEATSNGRRVLGKIKDRVEALHGAHRALDWPVIRKYLKRFYKDAYFRNPGYVWRRLKYIMKNREFFWNVYYLIKFWFILWGKPKSSEERTS